MPHVSAGRGDGRVAGSQHVFMLILIHASGQSSMRLKPYRFFFQKFLSSLTCCDAFSLLSISPQAIAGPLAETRLRQIPSSRVSWGQWTQLHPQTTVLSDQTGYDRDYDRDPYEGYDRVRTIWFPVGDVRRDLSPKDRVLGDEIGSDSKAYPLEDLVAKDGVVADRIADVQLRIRVSGQEVISVNDEQGQPVQHLFAYWFAWQAFHPQTDVHR